MDKAGEIKNTMTPRGFFWKRQNYFLFSAKRTAFDSGTCGTLT